MSAIIPMTAAPVNEPVELSVIDRLKRLEYIHKELQSVLPDEINIHAAKLKIMAEPKLEELSGVIEKAITIPAIRSKLLGDGTMGFIAHDDMTGKEKIVIINEESELHVDYESILVVENDKLYDVFIDTGCCSDRASLFVSLKTGKIYGLRHADRDGTYNALADMVTNNLPPITAADAIWRKIHFNEERNVYDDFVAFCDFIYRNIDKISSEIEALIVMKSNNFVAKDVAIPVD